MICSCQTRNGEESTKLTQLPASSWRYGGTHPAVYVKLMHVHFISCHIIRTRPMGLTVQTFAVKRLHAQRFVTLVRCFPLCYCKQLFGVAGAWTFTLISQVTLPKSEAKSRVTVKAGHLCPVRLLLKLFSFTFSDFQENY